MQIHVACFLTQTRCRLQTRLSVQCIERCLRGFCKSNKMDENFEFRSVITYQIWVSTPTQNVKCILPGCRCIFSNSYVRVKSNTNNFCIVKELNFYPFTVALSSIDLHRKKKKASKYLYILLAKFLH